MSLSYADDFRGDGRRIDDVGTVGIVTRSGDDDHSKFSRIRGGLGKVILNLTVGRAQRHIDNVHRIRSIAITVGVQGELYSLQQSYAAASGRHRTANLHRIEACSRRDTLVRRAVIAGDNVGDMSSVSSRAW